MSVHASKKYKIHFLYLCQFHMALKYFIPYIYIYIYIYFSGVKISALTQEIHFFQINALQIFNAINAWAGLGLATTFTTAASVSFFLKRIAFI